MEEGRRSDEMSSDLFNVVFIGFGHDDAGSMA